MRSRSMRERFGVRCASVAWAAAVMAGHFLAVRVSTAADTAPLSSPLRAADPASSGPAAGDSLAAFRRTQAVAECGDRDAQCALACHLPRGGGCGPRSRGSGAMVP